MTTEEDIKIVEQRAIGKVTALRLRAERAEATLDQVRAWLKEDHAELVVLGGILAEHGRKR